MIESAELLLPIMMSGDPEPSVHGGKRTGAGRPPKPDKHKWGRVTVILRHETIRALREGAASQNVGEFLQWHLDNYPLPTNYQYETLSNQYRDGERLRVSASYGSIPKRPSSHRTRVRAMHAHHKSLRERLIAKGKLS